MELTRFLRSLLAKKIRFPWLLEVEVAPRHMPHIITSSVFSRIVGWFFFFSHSWGWTGSCPHILFHLVLSGPFQGGHLGHSRHLGTAFLAPSLWDRSACVWRGSSLPPSITRVFQLGLPNPGSRGEPRDSGRTQSARGVLMVAATS
ncbi:hypothetical protein HJG60_008952 [Phyllostomus discolor]|uniref:Uncharacterized protein n=1 Tax=Phyllostomus discolor TaxID=89673 RepID=A0A833YZV3_9CHIR|nr:hypothetical protein HJG60_008952 [Phyllostomus discolor]